MFLIFALITLTGAVALTFQRNLVVAGLCLVLCFMGVAGLFLLLANPVAAALQIIVYSGAIVVLLLFVIMLLNEHQEEAAQRARPIQRWLSALVLLVLAAGAVRLVTRSQVLRQLDGSPLPAVMTLDRLGNVLFNEHLLAFEGAGLLLLAAMVGAVALVKRDL
jgi:NADH-quinone oxidoreductase subunit J